MSEEVVQPETVESTEGQGAAPYAEYLDKLPEDIRGAVEPVFKEWDSNVTKRFQEAAEFRKQWEPFQDMNLSDVPRDELENLIALRELAAESPEQFDEWLVSTALERGLLEQQAEDDPYAEDDSDPLEEKLNPLQSELNQLKEWKAQQEYEARVSEAMKQVEQQVEEASQKHPDVPQELAEQFLASFAESDPENAVSLAFEAAEKWMAQIQQGVVQNKLAQPEAAEQGSRADAAPEEIRDFATASRAALARLQNQ